jgi:hypothetical protein
MQGEQAGGATSFPVLSYEDDLGRSRDNKKWQYLTATCQGVARYSY